jgi:hypothetical protein
MGLAVIGKPGWPETPEFKHKNWELLRNGTI